jgi:hypothetical protein
MRTLRAILVILALIGIALGALVVVWWADVTINHRHVEDRLEALDKRVRRMEMR